MSAADPVPVTSLPTVQAVKIGSSALPVVSASPSSLPTMGAMSPAQSDSSPEPTPTSNSMATAVITTTTDTTANLESSTLESSKTTSSSSSKRHRPPMLVLNGNKDSSSSTPNSNFSNVNLTSLNKNSATTTTTLSATPSSSIFPSIRTPKDVVLQDLALQCISPGLPTFPSVIRDAMVKSKSIQEAQRKIIAQRMKGNGATFSQPFPGSENKHSINSEDDMDIDLDRSTENIKSLSSNSSNSSKSNSFHADSKNEINNQENSDKAEPGSNKLSNSAISLNNAKSNSPSLNNANDETPFSANSAANTNPKKSFNSSEPNIVITASRPSIRINNSFSSSATKNNASFQRSGSDDNAAPKSSSTPKPINSSIDKPKKQIIQSGNIIIEAVPTPTLPSHPNFTNKESSFMKPTTKRAPPPKGIKVTSFDSENPSIRSAPLYRGPTPFSPYSISKIPGYQAYYLNQALATQKDAQSVTKGSQQDKKQAQTTGSNGVSTNIVQHSTKNVFSRNTAQHTATNHSVYPHSAAAMSPVYPTHKSANPNSAAAFGYTRTPTIAAPSYYYTRRQTQPHRFATPGQYSGMTNTNGITAALSSAALGASVNGLRPGLTSTAASNFYRNPKMVPLYVSGRPTIPPMTASAAHWTGRTFRSHRFNKKSSDEDEDDDDDEDDGRDPEDAALSDDEADVPTTKKSGKRPNPSQNDDDDDLGDVEQRAISEEDERPVMNKKRRLRHVSSTSNINNMNQHVGSASAFTNGEMYDLASRAMTGGSATTNGPTAYNTGNSNPYFEISGNLNSKPTTNSVNSGSGSKTGEEIRQEYKKRRFMEICSEMWDLMRS